MSGHGWTMPAETAPHERTFMAWPTVRSDWFELLRAVRVDIVRIAQTIAQYEPVVLIADPADAKDAAPGGRLKRRNRGDCCRRSVGS